MKRSIACLALVGCAAPAFDAPPVVGSVVLLRETPRSTAQAAIGCALVDGAGGAWDALGNPVVVDWSGAPAPQANALGSGDVDGDGLLDVVEATSPEPSHIFLRHGRAACSFAPPVEVAGGAPGFHRGIQVDAGRIVVGVSDLDAPPARLLSWSGATWVESAAPKVKRPVWGPVFVTWFYHVDGSGCHFAGLDSGDGWIVGADEPTSERFASADPMGIAPVVVVGERRLFVGGLPGRSRLFALRGGQWTDTADEAGVAGPARAVTWQSFAHDLDGDGREDVVALALDGRNASDGRPRAPRILLQLDGGRFADVAAQLGAPRLYAYGLACLPDGRALTCLAESGQPDPGGQLFRVEVIR